MKRTPFAKPKINPLDTMFSEVIRRRALFRVGGCERCLSPKASWRELQCSHHHGRSSKCVRWDVDNAAGLCAGCHMYLEHHPLEHVEFFRSYLGSEAYDLLSARSRVTWPKPDKQGLKLYLESLLNQ